MYKENDKVVFRVGKEFFEYIVTKQDPNIWFLNLSENINSIIFNRLNIVDKFEFVKGISKYVTDKRSAAFPEIAYLDETEINKVIDALLKKCDEYNKQLNDTTSLRYKDGDKVVFQLSNNKKYNYTVVKSINKLWFLGNDDGYNDQIFHDLNITDKKQFCKDVSGCSISEGIFPEINCSDSTGISKVINKLMEMCEEKMKESLETKEKVSTETTSQKPTFKVGDYVRVIPKENIKSGGSYRFGFTFEMLKYCGEVYIVHKVSNCYSEAGSEPDDGMLYLLKTIAGTTLPYNFASSMLLPTPISPQLPFLKQIEFYNSLGTSGVQKTIDSEIKTVSKKSTPEYKLKFTN